MIKNARKPILRANVPYISRWRVKHSSTCSNKTLTHPVEESSKVLRHLEFIKPLEFQKGLQIQEKFVRAQLDMKALESKIKRKLGLLELETNGAPINEHEQKILDTIMNMKPNPIVLTFEFEPTYTGGKRSKKAVSDEDIRNFENFRPKDQVKNKSPKFVQAERGGQVTFHGPGQVVAYIVMDLKSFHSFPAKCLVSAIEGSTIDTLKSAPQGKHKTPLNLQATKTEETGVWIDEENKIASIGVHVRRSITSHGVSINVNPDLSYMNSFTMCGLPETRATSVLEQIPNTTCSAHDIAVTFVNKLAKKLGITTVERIQLDDIDID